MMAAAHKLRAAIVVTFEETSQQRGSLANWVFERQKQLSGHQKMVDVLNKMLGLLEVPLADLTPDLPTMGNFTTNIIQWSFDPSTMWRGPR